MSKGPTSVAVALCLLCARAAIGQVAQANPYVMHGSAVQNSCNCYTLTPEQFLMSGEVWNKNKIDLTQSFDYHFNVFLGCLTGLAGADGIAFVLQPVSTSEGSNGGGLGFSGIMPSLGVTLDTWPNVEDDDPQYDHIAFQANGDLDHDDTNNLAGPVSILASGASIKDCAWHVLDVKWDAPTMTLSASMDGVLRLTLTRDLVDSVFLGNPLVFWGFTGSTGGSENLQQFCTSLNAGHAAAANQEYCENVPIIFRDSSTSFGSIVRWYWNFGDGDSSNLQNPPPHVYPIPGVYTVTQNVLGNNGCLSDTNKTVLTIGSFPVASFTVGNACTDQPLPLVNKSIDSVGRFGTWRWVLSNGQTFADSLPSIVLIQPGGYTLQLSVLSAEGCPSNVTTGLVAVNPTPQATFSGDSVCVGLPLVLTGSSLAAAPIRQWYWMVGDVRDSTQTISHVYNQQGAFDASLWVVSPQGCISDTVTQTVEIQASNAFAGHDTAVALGYPIQLQASGGVAYTWSPPTGLSNPDIADPTATISTDTRYTVTAASTAGCLSSASILIKVYKGPAIYVPSAFTPNGDGNNDVLRIVAVGISELHYFRVFNRWGQEVFHSTDPRAGWDGTAAGHPVPSGTYVWSVQGTDLTGKVLTKQGTVLLIR